MPFRKIALLAVLLVTLAACRGRAAVPTPSPTVVATAGPPAGTPVPTNTHLPTQGAPESTLPPTATRGATARAPASATSATASATPSGSPSSAPSEAPTGAASATPPDAAGTNNADFDADVTVSDGTVFKPGESFVKTWKIKNSGAAAWTTGYALVHVRGDQMGAPGSVPLAVGAAPGATLDVSLTLTAPQKLGSYTSFWMLRSPAGSLFGIGADANQPVYVKIDVAAVGSTPQPTAPAGSITVTTAGLTVDTPSFAGTCPRTFIFTASFASAGAGDVTYQLEAESDKAGFVFTLPDPIKSTFNGAGPRTFTAIYQLQFTDSVSGRASLHILSPNDLQSGKLSFSLTCQT